MAKKVAQAASGKPALTPLAEHDAERNKAWVDALDDRAALVACPNCGNKLNDGYPVILHYPPQVSVYCAVCGWRGKRVA